MIPNITDQSNSRFMPLSNKQKNFLARSVAMKRLYKLQWPTRRPIQSENLGCFTLGHSSPTCSLHTNATGDFNYHSSSIAIFRAFIVTLVTIIVANTVATRPIINNARPKGDCLKPSIPLELNAILPTACPK